jgi:hypothetical protein
VDERVASRGLRRSTEIYGDLWKSVEGEYLRYETNRTSHWELLRTGCIIDFSLGASRDGLEGIYLSVQKYLASQSQSQNLRKQGDQPFYHRNKPTFRLSLFILFIATTTHLPRLTPHKVLLTKDEQTAAHIWTDGSPLTVSLTKDLPKHYSKIYPNSFYKEEETARMVQEIVYPACHC